MIFLILIEGSFQLGGIFLPFLYVATDYLNIGTSTSIKNYPDHFSISILPMFLSRKA